jgi:hypothetical protein
MSRMGLLPFLLASMALAAPAEARNMNGKFGVGYSQTLGGVSGLHLKYFVKDVLIEGTLGFDLFKPSDMDPRTSVKGAVGAFYNFARFEIANLGVGVRLDVGWRNGEAITASLRKTCLADGNDAATCKGVKGSSAWQFNLEIPLLAEVFFTDHFALNVQAGVVFTFVTNQNKALPQELGQMSTDTQEKGFGFGFGGGSLFGSAGFTVYF